MKKSTRLLIALGVIEGLLLMIGLWLINGLYSGALQAANDPAETVQTIFTTLGGVMGALGATVGIAIISMRRRGL